MTDLNPPPRITSRKLAPSEAVQNTNIYRIVAVKQVVPTAPSTRYITARVLKLRTMTADRCIRIPESSTKYPALPWNGRRPMPNRSRNAYRFDLALKAVAMRNKTWTIDDNRAATKSSMAVLMFPWNPVPLRRLPQPPPEGTPQAWSSTAVSQSSWHNHCVDQKVRQPL